MRISCGLVLSLLSLLAAANAHAADLYKCAGPKKDAVSIQSAPCAAGSKQIWMRDGTPDPPLTVAQIAAQNAKRQQDAEAARLLSNMAGTTQRNNRVVYRSASTTDERKQRCESAKRQAKQIRERDWRTLSFDRLRQLDAWVETECKNA